MVEKTKNEGDLYDIIGEESLGYVFREERCQRVYAECSSWWKKGGKISLFICICLLLEKQTKL